MGYVLCEYIRSSSYDIKNMKLTDNIGIIELDNLLSLVNDYMNIK